MYDFPTCWDIYTQISFLQRVILTHSFLYYMLDNSIWSDKKYDEVAHRLSEMQSRITKIDLITNTDYGYVFADFDGTTGFDLYYRLNKKDKKRIEQIARTIVGGNK